MDIASTLINVFVVVAVGAFLAYTTREHHRELREDLARLETRMDAGFTAIRSEFNTQLGTQLGAVRSEFNTQLGAVRSEFNGQFNAVRSDITAVALAVGAKIPRSSPQSGTG
jgi:hypothetical protein